MNSSSFEALEPLNQFILLAGGLLFLFYLLARDIRALMRGKIHFMRGKISGFYYEDLSKPLVFPPLKKLFPKFHDWFLFKGRKSKFTTFVEFRHPDGKISRERILNLAVLRPEGTEVKGFFQHKDGGLIIIHAGYVVWATFAIFSIITCFLISLSDFSSNSEIMAATIIFIGFFLLLFIFFLSAFFDYIIFKSRWPSPISSVMKTVFIPPFYPWASGTSLSYAEIKQVESVRNRAYFSRYGILTTLSVSALLYLYFHYELWK